ncbi:MAG: proliferating cell nuclear antigen (pcna) [Candidatus Methanofastidiosia archaeon]
MMFSARLKAKTWRKIVNAVSAIVEEVPIELTKKGIRFTAMDPSHISMIDFKMKSKHFEEYKLTEEFTIGIDLDEMKKIVNRSKPQEDLTMKADKSSLNLTFRQSDGESIRRFKLPIIDILGGENFKIPELSTTVKAKLSAYVFDDAIKDAYIVSDHITFHANKDGLIMRAQGEAGEIETEVRELLEYKFSEDVKATFNLSYLTDISKAVEDEITMCLGTDMPIRLEFSLDNSEIVFILAPRVERE